MASLALNIAFFVLLVGSHVFLLTLMWLVVRCDLGP